MTNAPTPSLGLEKLPDYLSGISEINAVANTQCSLEHTMLCFYYNAVVSTQCCAFINAVANTQCCTFINAVGSTQCCAFIIMLL